MNYYQYCNISNLNVCFIPVFRKGMDPTSPLCNRTVRDLTFKELMNCPLKSGARPPLLFDVLRSAVAISDDAKMIVEIKAGNTG